MMETYNGHVRTPQDAILLFEACRLGLLPRVQRRLSEKERASIKSGSVFVWDEREAGMRRWTDGKSWSASRVSGSFLTYREMEGKRGANNLQPQPAPTRSKSSGPKSSNGSQDGDSDEGAEGPDGYRYKPDGLMKQSFSITTQDGRALHLISYYNRSHMPPLKNPSNDHTLRNIQPPKGMYPENTVNEPTTMTPVGRPQMTTSPYPPHPPPGVVLAYAWPPPPHGYPPPPGAMAYPVAWPPSPSATPPNYYSNPHPAYVQAHYGHPQLPPFPHHAQHPLERPPPMPQSGLPPPQAPNGQHAWQQSRSSGAPPYHPPQHHAPHQNPYLSSRPSSDNTIPAPVASSYKPPSPPLSNGSQTSKQYSAPPPIKELPAANGNSPSNKLIPSITTLINGPQDAGRPPVSRGDSKSPARVMMKDPLNTINAAAMGIQRDRGDLKKLDSQLLKG